MTNLVLLPAIVLLTAGLAFAIGLVVVWANPERFTNQVFAATTLILTIQLLFVYAAVEAGIDFARDQTTDPVPWVRISSAISAFLPWMLWILKESLVGAKPEKLRTIRRSLPWLGLGLLLAPLCFTDWFIPPDSLPTDQKRGPASVLVSFTLVSAYIFLALQSWLQTRRLAGIRRTEMQFLVVNAGIAGVLSALFVTLGNLLHLPALKLFSNLSLAVYGVSAAWAISFQRIFDTRQVFLSLAQRIGLLFFFGVGLVGGWRGLGIFLPQPLALSLSVAVCGSAALWLDRKSREWFDLGGERLLAEMRHIVIGLARTELHPDGLVGRFEALLTQRCQTPVATLLFDQGEVYATGRLEFARSRSGFAALCEGGWATPEALERRRFDPGREDLRRYLDEHSLGLMVAVPHGSPNPSLLVAFGTKTNQWPFTYPEVQRLQRIAELMDNILIRSRLTLQAAQQARTEYLAMMSRGLAHDLKNLITPISSFLIHTDDRFAAGSAEAEVHAAARRSARLMTDYVRETLFFSERLAPKYEPVDLDRIFREVRGLTAARAARRGVTLAGTPEYGSPLAADAVLLQRVLANLVGNAIDASDAGQTVTFSATAGRPGWVRLQVVDYGCGIPPANLPRIFDPYFTTKEFGDDVRGFGLGLTICQKIVHLHGGTIAVHSELRRGTTFTVDLPAAPAANSIR